MQRIRRIERTRHGTGPDSFDSLFAVCGALVFRNRLLKASLKAINNRAFQILFRSILQAIEEAELDQERNKMKRTRILLASNRASTLAALRKSLEQEFDVVGMASDYRNLLAKGLKSEPEVILGDLELPLWNEPNLKRKLKQLIPKTKVLIVSIKNETGNAPASLRASVHGFAVRRTTSARLIDVLREFLEEPPYKVAETLPSSKYIFLSDHETTASRELTQRQREVLKLLAEGRTMKQTGEILKLTSRTIAFHKYKIMRDFELHNNLELLRLAIREHLVSAD